MPELDSPVPLQDETAEQKGVKLGLNYHLAGWLSWCQRGLYRVLGENCQQHSCLAVDPATTAMRNANTADRMCLLVQQLLRGLPFDSRPARQERSHLGL